MPPLVVLPPTPVPVVLTVVGHDVDVELTVLEPPIPVTVLEPPVPVTVLEPPVPDDEPLLTPEMTWVLQAQNPRMNAAPRSTV